MDYKIHETLSWLKILQKDLRANSNILFLLLNKLQDAEKDIDEVQLWLADQGNSEAFLFKTYTTAYKATDTLFEQMKALESSIKKIRSLMVYLDQVLGPYHNVGMPNVWTLCITNYYQVLPFKS